MVRLPARASRRVVEGPLRTVALERDKGNRSSRRGSDSAGVGVERQLAARAPGPDPGARQPFALDQQLRPDPVSPLPDSSGLSAMSDSRQDALEQLRAATASTTTSNAVRRPASRPACARETDWDLHVKPLSTEPSFGLLTRRARRIPLRPRARPTRAGSQQTLGTNTAVGTLPKQETALSQLLSRRTRSNPQPPARTRCWQQLKLELSLASFSARP